MWQERTQPKSTVIVDCRSIVMYYDSRLPIYIHGTVTLDCPCIFTVPWRWTVDLYSRYRDAKLPVYFHGYMKIDVYIWYINTYISIYTYMYVYIYIFIHVYIPKYCYIYMSSIIFFYCYFLFSLMYRVSCMLVHPPPSQYLI